MCPGTCYEAAEIDGANWWHKFRNVTVPMMSSDHLLQPHHGHHQLVPGLHDRLRDLHADRPGGTPTANARLVYLIYLYRNAFQYFKMGYASAMAWILFLVIVSLTLVMFRLQNRWVYYEGGKAR